MIKTQEYIHRLTSVERLIIVFYFTSPFLYLVRLFFAEHLFSVLILRTFEPILMLTTFVFLLRKRIRVDFYFIIQVFFLFWGVSIAIISKNQVLDIVAGVTHFVTGLLLYLYFFNLSKDYDRMLWFFEKLSYYVLFSVGVVILYIYAYNYSFNASLYLGLACQALIPVFFFLCYKKKMLLAVICFLLVVLSGKRGVLVALILSSILVMIPIIFSRYFNLKTLSLLVAGLIVTVTFLYLGFADSVIHKFQFDSSKGLDGYSSGRYQEFLSAVNYWISDSFRVLWGAGFGFNYTYVYEQIDIPDVEDYKNVHFSYVNPLIIFGVYFGFLYLLSFVCLVFSLLVKLSSYQKIGVVYKATLISFCIYACFVFNLFNEPIFLALLGSLSAYRRPKYEKTTG